MLFHLLDNLLPVHAEFKTLQLDAQHGWGCFDGHALGCPHQALLPGALVLVGALQISRQSHTHSPRDGFADNLLPAFHSDAAPSLSGDEVAYACWRLASLGGKLHSNA